MSTLPIVATLSSAPVSPTTTTPIITTSTSNSSTTKIFRKRMFLKRTLKIILALIFVWGAFFHFVDVYHIYIAEQVEEDQFELSAVYTWVNGSDPAYLEQKRQFPPPGKKMDSSSDSGTLVDTGNNRWRDNGELKFSLRSLHQNAKWLKKIYIVINDGTNPPSWLNTKHKKNQNCLYF